MQAMISVVHSLPDPATLALHVAGHFDIGPIDDCRLWRSFINDVYRLEAGGRAWWLRIHPFGWRTPWETAAEMEAILAIAAAGGSVARPVPVRDGGYLIAIPMPEGTRTAVLFEDAPGADLHYYESDRLENARRYGVAVATLHLACYAVRESPARKPFDLDTVVIQPSIEVAQHIRPEDRGSFARMTDALVGMLSGRDDLTSGFCHGDLNNANMHFQGGLATAFDFDCCAWGWRAFELAAFARGVTWYGGPDEATDELIRTFFHGYLSLRPLAAADLAIQPAMLLAQRLWVTSLHLKATDRLGSFRFGETYLARFTKWLHDWNERLLAPSVWT
jgi:Ser/Thr protein kinase RdoA (MazF antagonist)